MKFINYLEYIIFTKVSKGVKRVRLPIGDWTLTPYGPYVGCMDGAADYI